MEGEVPNLVDNSVQVGDSIFHRVNNLVNTIFEMCHAKDGPLRSPEEATLVLQITIFN